jgi:hypothetical protein
MQLDALATEPHFLDHLAAIWSALPARQRGRFAVRPELAERARSHGIKPSTTLTGGQRPVIVAAYGDLKRARAAGRERIAFAEHGAGQSYSNDHPSYSGGKDRGDVGLFLVPNQHAADRNRARYPDTRIDVIGCPKLELLPKRAKPEDDRPTIAISFHWQCGVSFETRSAWRAYRNVLPQLAKTYRVLGHAHPKMLGTVRPYYERLGIEVVSDFADVCRRADLYVCDNSSTLYEFASTGRPVVVMNAPWYRRRVKHGLRFWDAAGVGINVDRQQQLIAAIKRGLADPADVRRDRQAALRVAYAYRTGAAKRAATALLEWAS